jgi:hypothetical protein
MANQVATRQTTNIVPVQGIFGPEPSFPLIHLVGPAGSFFSVPIDPNQSGLAITNSTINSSIIGGITPAAAFFTTAQVAASPTVDADVANKAYVDSVAQGLDIKASCLYTTTNNITLSGLTTQAGGDWPSALTAGDRILVKNQSNQAQNGIYTASATGWTRTADMNIWSEVPGAFTFIEDGVTLLNTGWVTNASPTGIINATAMPWTQFSGAGTYTAGTGLTLIGTTFNIANTTVVANSYGSASQTLTATVNAQGQLTALAATNIAIGATQITSGTIDSARISGVYSGITGLGTLLDLTVTNTITGSINGNAATATTAGSATTATTATNLAGGGVGSVPYQTGAGATSFLAAGSNGQVLTLAGGIPSWATPTVGTVTSVGGTGTVSGISLSGTVTSSGNLTLGGSLDLSSPPAIGNTAANTVRGTTVTATTKFVGPFFDAATSAGGALRNAGGTAQLQWGAGGGDNLSLNVSTNINGANAQIDISPTGTGHVHIKPAGAGSVEIAPTIAGTINNMSIGATTAASGKFTTIDFSGTLAVSGVTGTAGQVLQSNGTSAPTWVTPVAYATVTDDTTTNGTRYPLFANQTSGSLTTIYAASTKYQFNPSTGILTATGFSGSGANLTSLPAGQLSGTIPSSVLGNSSLFIGTTSIALNRASASQSLTGVSIDGSAGSATTAGTATNANNIAITDNTSSASTYYPVMSVATTGNNAATTSSTKLSFVPSTGVLSATSFSGAGTGLTGTASGLSIGGNAATATSATTATNVAGGAANRIVYNTAAGTTNFIVAPTVANTYLEWSGSAFQWSTNPLGTVTSVGLALPVEFTISNSPVTTSGTLTGAWASQTAKYVLAAPNASNGTPSFRALVASDIPTLNQNTTGQAGSVANSVTFTNTGGGAAGTTYNGSAARTVDYSTVGAPSATGTGASGTWNISISGNAATATSATSATSATNATNSTNIGITDDTSTNADYFPVWVTNNTGNLPAKVSSTKLKFNPSTGIFTATGGTGGGNF